MQAGFLTVPEELLGVAEKLREHFQGIGYSVKIEDESRLDYPYLPALRCRRGATTLLVEVVAEIPPRERLREWRAYCTSQPRDTRFALGVPMAMQLTSARLADLGTDGIGIFTVNEEYEVQELLAPHDLPMRIQPPALNPYPNRVRKTLGPAWDEIRRGNWREGFDAACIALETECRRYLNRKTSPHPVSTPGGVA